MYESHVSKNQRTNQGTLVLILKLLGINALTLFLSQSGDEFFGSHGANFLLLCGDGVKQVGQAGQQSLFAPLVLGLVFQHLVPERLAKVEGLKD